METRLISIMKIAPPPPFQDPPKEDFVWQGTSSPGVGVLRFNGATWETGWHFCPRDSLNVIINQPTSLFFEAPSNGIIMSEQGGYRDGVHNNHSCYFIFFFFLHDLCPTCLLSQNPLSLIFLTRKTTFISLR